MCHLVWASLAKTFLGPALLLVAPSCILNQSDSNQFKSQHSACVSYRVTRAMALKYNNVENHLGSKICKSTYMGEPLVLNIINFSFELMQDFKSSFVQYNHSLKFSFLYSANSKKLLELFRHWKRGNSHLLFIAVWIAVPSKEHLAKTEEGPSHAPRTVWFKKAKAITQGSSRVVCVLF